MTRIYLIRHGENLDGQIDGRGPVVDLGLTDVGRGQVTQLCHRLKDGSSIQPTALLTSPERRAKESADMIASALGLPVSMDSRLEEWRSDDGTMPQEEFLAQWRALPDVDRAYHRFLPHCETQAEFFARVGEVLHHMARAHSGGSMLVVTHGGFIQAAFRHFFGFGDAAFRRAYPICGHASLTLWRAEAGTGRWALEYSNDRSHIGRIA